MLNTGLSETERCSDLLGLNYKQVLL